MINFDSSKHQPHHGLVSVGPGSADWPCWQYTYKEAGTCYVKTAAQAQQLPIVGMDTEACDPYSMQPHFWLPVRLDAITWFFAFTGQGHHALGCAQQLAQAIQEADVSPGSPSFRQRCTFCKANPYLCDETQLNLCRLHAQAHRANARNKGAFSDSTLNAFNLLLASSACARGPLESVCGSRAMTPWAVLIDQWRLWIAVAYCTGLGVPPIWWSKYRQGKSPCSITGSAWAGFHGYFGRSHSSGTFCPWPSSSFWTASQETEGPGRAGGSWHRDRGWLMSHPGLPAAL